LTAARRARDPPDMLSHAIYGRGEILLRQSALGALVALGVALVLAALAAFLPLAPRRRAALGGAAPTLAVVAGLVVCLGMPTLLHVRTPAARLPELVCGLFGAALLAERLRRPSLMLTVLGIASLAGSWWVLGAHLAVTGRAETVALVASAVAVMSVASLTLAAPGPLPLLAAGLALWAALHLAGGATLFAQLALAMTAGCVAMLTRPRDRPRSLWPVAGGLAAVAVAASFDAGRIAHHGVNRVDWAACAPLLVLACVAALRRRGWGNRGAGALAAVAVVLLVWVAGDFSR